MIKRLVTLAFLFALTCGSALAAADVKLGKTLHDKQCTSCHVSQFGGDGSKMYTRSPRKINDLKALQQRVAGCSAQTGAKWLPDEEAAVVAYLAKQYYKFK